MLQQNQQKLEKRGSQENSLHKEAVGKLLASVGSAAMGQAAKVVPWAMKAAPAVNNAMRLAPGAASVAGKAAPVANAAAKSVAMPARVVGNTVAGISKGVVKAKNQAASVMPANVNPMWREFVRRPVTTATNMHGATRFPNARVIPGLQPVGPGSGLGGHHMIASPASNLWDKVKGVGGRIWNNETFQNTMNTSGLGMAADMAGTYMTGEENDGTLTTLGAAAGLLPAALRRLPGGAALGNTIGKRLKTINSSPYAQKVNRYVTGATGLGMVQRAITGHDYITNPIGSAEDALQEKMRNTATELGFQSPEHMQAALSRMSRVARIFTPAPQPPQADPLF